MEEVNPKLHKLLAEFKVFSPLIKRYKLLRQSNGGSFLGFNINEELALVSYSQGGTIYLTYHGGKGYHAEGQQDLLRLDQRGSHLYPALLESQELQDKLLAAAENPQSFAETLAHRFDDLWHSQQMEEAQ